MNLLIAPPKAGTHLFGFLTASKEWLVALRPEAPGLPLTQFEPDSVILARVKQLDPHKNYKGHIPCRPALARITEKFDNVILVLRDPRDIIVSMAHAVGKHDGAPINYHIGGGKMDTLPLGKRIDYLINNMLPVFMLFDRWIVNESIQIFHYDQFMNDPERVFERLVSMAYGSPEILRERAKKRAYTYRTARSGDWMVDMTKHQAQRSADIYGDLIKTWNPYD
jgi:hypothetical protein